MIFRVSCLCVASTLALMAGSQAQAQTSSAEAATPAPSNDASAAGQQGLPTSTADETAPQNDIVVTGIRQSLERAAEIKRDAVQVVDSVVAQDIGKLPDPTTAAALQRVPGIQVSTDRDNQLGDVRVRGLPDVLTTVNGREVFTTTGRGFSLTDMPAEALQGINVYKSQTSDLIDGGLAGVIDLKLSRPFDFKDPTIVVAGRGSYVVRSGKFDPEGSILATKRWDTNIGEIGVLLNGSWSRSDYRRAQTILRERRSSDTTPLNTPGILVPTILQNFPEQGFIEHQEFNGAVQWQASPALQVYAEGFYTYFRDRGAHTGANIQPFTNGTTITSVTPSNRCITTRAGANGQNTTADVDPVELCEPDSITFANLVSNQTTSARDLNQRNKAIAGGFNYDQGPWHSTFDVSFQRSQYHLMNITSDIGQRLDSLTLVPRDGDHASYTVPGDALTSRDNLYIRNALIQDYTYTKGSLFQVRDDLNRDLDGFLSNIAVGVRYARRTANQYSLDLNTPIPGGNIGTASEATAVKVSDTGLPDDFLALGAEAPDLNGGTRFYVPNPDFLLDESSLDLARAYFGLPAGRPDFQPGRQFESREETMAGYLQGKYSVDLSSSMTFDGVIGARFVQTDRTIKTFAPDGSGGFDPVSASTVDRDILPNATARLKFGNGLQARVGYSQSIRRPDFSDLNPAVTLNLSNNPLVQSTGSAGNPDLKAQKSQSFDATLEYYFRGGYVSVAGYYRDITNRVITSAAVETIDGTDYAVSRPRNVGKARLDGVEVSGQYFLQFLPGALSGLGVQGAFTFADSKVQGDDPLAGNPLQGVSKYNYTSALLYEKYGISGRLVYTYRSRYFGSDESGTPTLRPVDSQTLLSYVRPAGRLDFSIGYDVTDNLRVDIGGTNILRTKTTNYYKYLNYDTFNHEADYDETTYTVGVRIRL